MDLDPRRLAVLLAVHRNGGVVAAADSLHVSPSAVSQQIRLLERESGARVLDREPTGAVLTRAGRVLAETAETIEAELASAARELIVVDTEALTGTVRVGSFQTAVRALLLPLLTGLEESLPGVDLVVEEVEERAGISRLRHGQIDLLLLERDSHEPVPAPRGFADIAVLDESWLVAVGPGTPAPSTLGDLVRASWLDIDPTSAGRAALDRLGRQLGTPLTTRHVIYDYDVALAMVEQGLGCALLPELAVHGGQVPNGVSVARLPGLGTRQIMVRHRSTRTEPDPSTRAVLEALLAEAAGLELG